jgi:hypothetical protein
MARPLSACSILFCDMLMLNYHVTTASKEPGSLCRRTKFMKAHFRLKRVGLLALNIIGMATANAGVVTFASCLGFFQQEQVVFGRVSACPPAGISTEENGSFDRLDGVTIRPLPRNGQTLQSYDFFLAQQANPDPTLSRFELSTFEINSAFTWSTVDGNARKMPERDKVTVLLEGGSRTHEYTLTFQASNGVLTGQVTAPNGTMPILNGKINGETLSFSMKMLGGQFTATVTGLIAGDELRLSGLAAGRPFQITAERVHSSAGARPGVLKFKYYNTQ